MTRCRCGAAARRTFTTQRHPFQVSEMSWRKFFVCLSVIIAVGLAIRYWPEPALPDMPVDDYIKQGFQFQRKMEYRQAIRYYSAALQKDPRNWKALAQRGICYVATQEYDKSLEDLDRSIRFSNGASRTAIFQRSVLYWLAGQFDEAMTDANTLIKGDPKDFKGYAIRAKLYEDPKRGDAAKAKADNDMAISLMTPEERARMKTDPTKP
jgi:tetratricopeptide (TPR) repeat protein